MTNKATRNENFDLHQTLKKLEGELGEDPRLFWGPTSHLNESTPFDERIAVLYPIVFQHTGRHGISNTMRCEDKPCRLGGVCYAILEMVSYVGEKPWAAEFLEYADHVENIRSHLLEAKQSALAIDRFSRKGHPAAVRGMRIRASYVMDAFMELFAAVNESSSRAAELGIGGMPEEMRAQILSEQLKSDRGAKLLNAIIQHLHWGGYTPTEIAKMRILPTPARTIAAETARVNDRLKRDCRSIHPYEPDSDAHTTTQA